MASKTIVATYGSNFAMRQLRQSLSAFTPVKLILLYYSIITIISNMEQCHQYFNDLLWDQLQSHSIWQSIMFVTSSNPFSSRIHENFHSQKKLKKLRTFSSGLFTPPALDGKSASGFFCCSERSCDPLLRRSKTRWGKTISEVDLFENEWIGKYFCPGLAFMLASDFCASGNVPNSQRDICQRLG